MDNLHDMVSRWNERVLINARGKNNLFCSGLPIIKDYFIRLVVLKVWFYKYRSFSEKNKKK